MELQDPIETGDNVLGRWESVKLFMAGLSVVDTGATQDNNLEDKRTPIKSLKLDSPEKISLSNRQSITTIKYNSSFKNHLGSH